MRRQGIYEDAELIRRLKLKTGIEIKPPHMSRIFGQERSISVHALLGLTQVLEMESDRRNKLLRREGFGMFIQLLDSGKTPDFSTPSANERVWNTLTAAALRDKNSDVRWDAVETLWELDSGRATELMVSVALQDKDPSVRRKTLEILKESGNMAAELFLKALEHENLNVRKNAVSALSKLQSTLARDSLLHALQHSDREVTIDAAKALGELGDERTAEILIAVLRDGNPQMRSNAVEALGYLSDKRAMNPLITALQDENVQVRLNAVRVLGQLKDKEAVVPLIRIIKDENVRVRREVVVALAKLGDPQAVDPLITALQDIDPDVCSSAIRALGVLGDERAVKPLIKILTASEMRKFSFDALQSLATTTNMQTWDLLAASFRDKSTFGRRELIKIFSKFDDERTLKLLIDSLRDNDLDVCEEAERILSERGIDWQIYASRNFGQQLRKISKKFWEFWNVEWDRDSLPGG